MKAKIFTDGASRGNPGVAGAGAIIITEDERQIEISKFLGRKTNNQAEYKALILALKKAISLNITEIVIHSDSELLVKQLKREYKLKSKNLTQLFKKAQKLLTQFKKAQYIWTSREKNKKADKLANKAIEKRLF